MAALTRLGIMLTACVALLAVAIAIASGHASSEKRSCRVLKHPVVNGIEIGSLEMVCR